MCVLKFYGNEKKNVTNVRYDQELYEVICARKKELEGKAIIKTAGSK